MVLRYFLSRFRRNASTVPHRNPRYRSLRNRLRGLEHCEARRLLAGDLDLRHNSVDPEDVNDDAQITVVDALMVVETIDGRARPDRRQFADVDGDGAATPRDVRRIVERVRRGDTRSPRDDRRDRQDLPPAPIDGAGVIEASPDFGAAGQTLLRISDPEYGDGVSTPAGEDRPSAREISNAVAAQQELDGNARGLSDLVWIWGQFIDHDLDLTEGGDGEDFSIEVPTGDPQFDPFGTGEAVIPLTRSEGVEGTGTSADNPLQQANHITAWLDGSVVYGSDEERALALRTLEGGRLTTSDGDLLPFNEAGLENAGGVSDSLFLAGDIRANENVALSAMHTIWVREHNRIADEIAAENPDWTDEQIYQQARALVRAELQAITYNEFLPALLGQGALTRYRGFDPTVNPGIANEFSTGVYRFGHSMLSPETEADRRGRGNGDRGQPGACRGLLRSGRADCQRRRLVAARRCDATGPGSGYADRGRRSELPVRPARIRRTRSRVVEHPTRSRSRSRGLQPGSRRYGIATRIEFRRDHLRSRTRRQTGGIVRRRRQYRPLGWGFGRGRDPWIQFGRVGPNRHRRPVPAYPGRRSVLVREYVQRSPAPRLATNDVS